MTIAHSVSCLFRRFGIKMLKIFSAMKNVTFLVLTCASLFLSTAALAVTALQLSSQVAGLTASATAAGLANRRAISAAVARAKAKARLRRIVASVPIAGIAAAGYFERRDFLEWQTENPNGTFEDYSCEVARLSADVIDEVLQELPEAARPSKDFVISSLSDCSQ